MKILVAGSAYLDVKALSSIHHQLSVDDYTDRSGDLSVDFGGVAYKTALIMAELGHQISFVSAMNKSVFSSLLIEYLNDNHIETHVTESDDLPLGGVFSHINNANNCVNTSVVSNTPIDKHEFNQESIKNAMQDCKAAIFDSSLSLMQLILMAGCAKEMKIPFFIITASHRKATVLTGLSRLHLKPAMTFMDWQDAQAILSSKNFDPSKLQGLSNLLNFPIVVTRQKYGVYFTDGTKFVPFISPETSNMTMHYDIGHTSEYLACQTIHQLLNGQDVEDVLKITVKQYYKHNQQKNSINPNNSIEKKIYEIQQNAKYDSMTGLINHTAAEKAIERLIKRAIVDQKKNENTNSGVFVFFCDIDHFKKVNDTYGHEAGDIAIKMVAQCVNNSFRPTDICSRWGGEEFVIVLSDIDHDTAWMIAERFRENVSKKIKEPCHITISIGIAQYNELMDKEDFNITIFRADKALYEAKEKGRNRTVLL